MTGISVEAISLHGSSEPGSFAVLENVVRFTLKVDPPEAAKPNLPPGIKKGDSSGMIMLSTIWWNSDGKIARELEYGKLLWEGFDINDFNTFWEEQACELPDRLWEVIWIQIGHWGKYGSMER